MNTSSTQGYQEIKCSHKCLWGGTDWCDSFTPHFIWEIQKYIQYTCFRPMVSEMIYLLWGNECTGSALFYALQTPWLFMTFPWPFFQFFFDNFQNYAKLFLLLFLIFVFTKISSTDINSGVHHNVRCSHYC